VTPLPFVVTLSLKLMFEMFMPILLRGQVVGHDVISSGCFYGDTIPVHAGIVAPYLVVIGMNQQESAVFVFRSPYLKRRHSCRRSKG